MYQPNIVVLAGSLRSGSYNKMLASLVADAAIEAGAKITTLDLRDLALPLFDEDLEAASGLPEGALKLKALFRASDGFIIASPEYNSSITAVLKNAIDWASRAESEEEAPLSAYKGKIAVLCSASPGVLGGLRGLVTLRSILGNIGVLVLPDQVCLSAANKAFDEANKLKDERKAKQVIALANTLVDTIRKQKG